MFKKILILFASFSAVYGVTIPEEEQMTCSTLPNGVQMWLKSTTEGSFYCRIVACQPGQESPQIFSLDDCTQEEFVEEEMPVFVPNMMKKISNQSRVGVVVVGPFEKEEMERFVTEAFETVPARQPASAELPIVITPSEKVSTSLLFTTPFPTIKTVVDLKEMWILGLLRSIFDSQMQASLLFDKKGARWAHNASYMLPYSTLAARAEIDSNQEPVYVLTRFLSTLQMLKSSGFTNEELSQAKAKVTAELQHFYQKDPNNRHLADYYAFHLALGDRCPSYQIFMPMSIQMIQEIEKADFEKAIQESFKTDQCQIEIKAPAGLTQEVVQEVITPFKVEFSEIEWKEDKVYLPLEAKAKEIFESLPMTPKQAVTIREIVETMYNKNPLQLGLIRAELERKGKSVDDVHPLRFLAATFTDPQMKKYMKTVHESYFKWDGFLNGSGSTRGFWAKMESEHKKNNLLPYVEGFCLSVKANPAEVETIIKNKGWDKLVLYLIYKD